GGALPRLSGVLVLVATPADRAGRSRLSSRRTRHAWLRPDRPARFHRPVHAAPPGRRHGRVARRARRRLGGERRPPLGGTRGLARRPAPPGPVPRRHRPERSIPAPRARPSHYRHAADRRRDVLPALLPGPRGGRGGTGARRPHLDSPPPVFGV